MAFLTISNSLRILRKIDKSKLEEFSGEVYKKTIFFFSKYEEKILLGLQELWKDPQNFIDRYYQPIKIQDDYKYVFEGTQPAYHFDSSCPKLKSHFINFEVPEEIRNKGEQEVIKFREWFKKHMHLLEKPEVFTMMLFHAFGIQVNPKSIDYDNSGVEEKENLDLHELENRIDSIISQAGKFWKDNPDKQSIIRRFQKYTFLGYKEQEIENNDTGLSDEELKEFLKQYDTDFKKPIKDLLIEYYRVKLNPDLQFEGMLLEKLGFRPCSTCNGKQGNIGNVSKETLSHEPKKVPDKIQQSELQSGPNLTPAEEKELLNKLNW